MRVSARRVTPLDAYLALAAIAQFPHEGRKTKLQKVMFSVEHDATYQDPRREVFFPSFYFYRWNHGPYSMELANLETKFAHHGLVTRAGGRVTEQGLNALRAVRSEVMAYPLAAEALTSVEKYASEYGWKPLDEVLGQVYSRYIELEMGKVTVADTPMMQTLVDPSVEQVYEEYLPLYDLLHSQLNQSEDDRKALRASPTLSDEETEIFRGRLKQWAAAT